VWPYHPDVPVDFDESKMKWVLFYKRISEPVKILSGDWIDRKNPIREIERFLNEKKHENIGDDDIIEHIKGYLKYE
jgi:hypothetical protein